MKRQLRKIFNYYKKKYELKTKFVFQHLTIPCFGLNTNTIYYNLLVRPTYLENREHNRKEELIWMLLHELKHAIDYTKHSQLKNEEEIANKFAYKEMLKWR